MDIETLVRSAQGGHAIGNLASAFSVPPNKAAAAADALMQALAVRFERNAISRGGLADIVSMLGNPNAGRAIADPDALASPAVTAAGDEVLDVLIGNKHISRGITQNVARQTGVDDATLRKMLPVVASMMVGGLQNSTNRLFAQKFGDIPGLEALRPKAGAPLIRKDPSSSGGQIAEPRPASSGKGGGGLLPMPKTIPRSDPATGEPRSAPSGSKGTAGRSGYDDLSDIIRRGGGSTPGGGSLDAIVRNILGNLLGFKNRGVVSSIIYMLVTRFVVNFVRRMLSRFTLGR